MTAVTAPPPMSLVRRYWRDRALWTVTSIGLRLDFWEKSLGLLSEAPVVGHGTGSLRGLFERAATDYSNSARSKIIRNPHNQTLNVAVQWVTMGSFCCTRCGGCIYYVSNSMYTSPNKYLSWCKIYTHI